MRFEGKSIFFIGDSITANGTFLKYLRTYFKRTGRNVSLYNKGIPGGTLTILHTALEEELHCEKPDVAVICFGVNDLRYWEYNSDILGTEKLEQTREKQRTIYAEKMNSLIEKLSKLGITPILCSPFAVSRYLAAADNIETVVDSKEKSSINNKFYNTEVFAKINESLNELRDFLKSFSEERGIEFWDNFNATYELSESSTYNSDGIHFSAVGNQLIAKLILKNMYGEELTEFETDGECEEIAAREFDERAYFFIKYNIMRPVVPERTSAQLSEKVREWIQKNGNTQGLTKEREEGFFRYLSRCSLV
ncbi:MAG: hypothetical protein IJY23_05730 [Clostridia bacterium]|nr:hypothetical protein [Clostridia bacterium]